MNFYQKLTTNARDALRRAIREFISPEEIIPESYLNDAAMEYVMEHDKEIKDALRDIIDLDNIFEEEIDQAIEDAYEQY